MEVNIQGVKVDTAVLENTASRMRMFNGNLFDVLTAVRRKMNDMQTNAVWLSPAGADIIAKINAKEPQFKQQRDTLDSYCNFLNGTARQYKAAEANRRQDAATNVRS